MKTFKWDEKSFGEINFENICRIYSSDKSIIFSQNPPFIRAFYAVKGKNKYAVRWNRYESGANFTEGKSKIKIEEKIYNLEAGEYYKIPKCTYEFSVIGNETFECVTVYELPNDFLIPEVNN